MKCNSALPKFALSAAVENCDGAKSEGRNGPFGMTVSTQRKRPAEADLVLLPLIETTEGRPRWYCSPTRYAITADRGCVESQVGVVSTKTHTIQPKSESCASSSFAVGQSGDFLRFFAVASGSTRWMPAQTGRVCGAMALGRSSTGLGSSSGSAAVGRA